MSPARWSLLLSVLAGACARGEVPSPSAATTGARVEVVSKSKTEGVDGEVQVRFRVVNGTAREITYPGFASDLPTFSLEFQEGGAWSTHAVGWCGTGLLDFTLAPGAEMSFQVALPADGRTYRASFGDPLVVTPAVVASAN